MSHFSDTLIHLRKSQGLSQQQLSEKTGLSRSAIGMYETGKREPDMDTLKIFSEFFQVDMNTLISPGTAADSEMSELLEALRSRPDMRILFKLAKDASPEDVRKAAKIIEALRND
ncbi:MAG: helix-turn-helix domain-containing protein [Candidatus Limivicinus sp.]|jgi:transcriptional regulator with XRE-family HTH domain